MKIISIIDWFKIGNGATSAITAINNFFMQEHIEHNVLCDYLEGEIPPFVHIFSDEKLIDLIRNRDEVIIHFYLSGGIRGKGIFRKLINCCMRNNISVPIVTTVLQKPSYPYCMLTPFIIRNSTHVVFIDKASYNDPLYAFIPENRKSMLYCSFPIPQEKINYYDQLAETRLMHNKEERFVFGRGSVINKCPKDTIEVFNKIDVDSKQFIICGVDDESWIAKKALKFDNIVTYPNKKYSEWELLCSTFDVFLYYLPEDTYSSLDGNLGLAMKLGIPPVVYGPAAPKERIIHGVNGFIANSKEEIVKYAQILYEDDELRKMMGKNARDMTYKMLHGPQTIKGYYNLYKSLLMQKHENNIYMPNVLPLICFAKKHTFMLKVKLKKIERAIVLLVVNPKGLINKIKKI